MAGQLITPGSGPFLLSKTRSLTVDNFVAEHISSPLIEPDFITLQSQDGVNEGGEMAYAGAGVHSAVPLSTDRFQNYWRVLANANESLRVGTDDVRVQFGGTETFFASLAAIRLNNQEVTFGANDSAGVGFRQVRVPNTA